MRYATWIVLAALPLVGVALWADDAKKSGLDDEGFVQNWVVLAPIAFEENQNPPDALDKEFIKEEGKLQPKDGDKQKVGNKDLSWKKHTSEDYLLNFNGVIGADTEDSVAYAVTYITAPEEVTVKLKIGSDDQTKVFLNGKEVIKHTEERATEKDQDAAEVTLKKGLNILVAKVVNAKGEWSFCARFTDGEDKPIKNLTAKYEQ